MIPDELAEHMRSRIQCLKEAQGAFMETLERLCEYHGGPNGLRKKSEMVFHRVRCDIVPIMEKLGMDQRSIEALCTWAEHLITKR